LCVEIVIPTPHQASNSSQDRQKQPGSDEFFKTALQTAPTAILMIDPHQDELPIVFANNAFHDLTGYAPDETLGRSCRFLEGPDTNQETASAVLDALHDGRCIEADLLCYRKNGQPFWNAMTAGPIRNGNGDLRCFICFQNDISAKIQSDHDLANAKESLEKVVEERTRELKTALDEKTALLHEVEHRVKNSLQMIASLVLLKGRRTRDPATRQILQDMAERVSALSHAHRLLYASEDVGSFNLADFTRELAEEHVAALPQGQIALHLDLASVDIPAAKAAPLALLLNELIGNAIKHAFPDARPGRLTIQVERVEEKLQIVVQDDGIGLRPAPVPEGSFGKTLIEMLARQLKGQLTWRDMDPGTRAAILMPVDAEETSIE
jgi:PAS domain S-box-containing protein